MLESLSMCGLAHHALHALYVIVNPATSSSTTTSLSTRLSRRWLCAICIKFTSCHVYMLIVFPYSTSRVTQSSALARMAAALQRCVIQIYFLYSCRLSSDQTNHYAFSSALTRRLVSPAQ